MSMKKYCVITIDSPIPTFFNEHETAFAFCESRKQPVKGVFVVMKGEGETLELGEVNVWLGAGLFNGGHENLLKLKQNCYEAKTVLKFHII